MSKKITSGESIRRVIEPLQNARRDEAAHGGVPVSMHALIQRINRRLKPEGRMLKITRGQRARFDLGDYYVLNVMRNWIDFPKVDPEAYGRELGVLEPWEEVHEEEVGK